MTISYEKFLISYSKVKAWGPDHPFNRLFSAVYKAAEIPGKPGRSDPSKVDAFLTLYGDVEKDMPAATQDVILVETERRWTALADRQKDAAALKPRPVSRVFADTPGPQ
jgi:hypothetical protein